MATLRPALEVRSPSGKLLGLMDDGVIRRTWIETAVLDDDGAGLFARLDRPEPLTARIITLQIDYWGESRNLGYRCVRASTEDPSDLRNVPTFRRPAEKVLR